MFIYFKIVMSVHITYSLINEMENIGVRVQET